MSASSTIASSTLTRSRVIVLSFATIATCFAFYGFYRNSPYYLNVTLPGGTGLHRSNAVHRRRRRNTTGEGDDETTPIFIDDTIENDGQGNLVTLALTDGETVVDDQGLQDDSPWIEVPQSFEHQRNGQNIVQLLFRVSEDATRRNAYVHRGCACNSCGTVPIRGVRYRCANCVDYDLCEGCESQGMHTKTHIFYKIKVPASSFGPRHIQPVWYSGDPDSVTRVLPREILTKLSRETGFERPELDAYWEQWTFMANTDWRDDPDEIHLAMDRKTFERCLVPSGGYRQSAPNLMFDRMFAFYDTNKDDIIGFSEFLHGIAYRKKKDKWSKIFEGYDIDGDGFVDRKDFLRMFRSYYVFYRQMHRDMLEGMEEQTMSGIDAHRLVNSRQPLSSAFGQDGRFPRAPDPRTGEGKTPRANGDFDIVDGKGVINESSNDTGNREDVFRRDINSQYKYNPQTRMTYWETLLNLPENLSDMPRVLNSLERNQELSAGRVLTEIWESVTDENATSLDPPQIGRSDTVANGPHDRESNHTFNEPVWPPTDIQILDEDVEAIEGPGRRLDDVPLENRRQVIAQAIFREGAHKDVYERWQRRYFYTDEEEGAIPPEDWKEDDDILANGGMSGESSKVSRPVHSRSSSKVRFAEDMDDFDTRSNPSTSSRSVPERWGGMEIPDAEKDAGKEILYQVTQQAFNELLDPLFKEREDLAIESAASLMERDRYRSTYSTPEFEAWAVELEAKTAKEQAETGAQNPEVTYNPIFPTFAEVELEQIRERPLEDLLAATGYQVDAPIFREVDDSMPDLQQIPTPELTRSSLTTTPTIATRPQNGAPEDDENSEERAPQDTSRPLPIRTSFTEDDLGSRESIAPTSTPNNPASISPTATSTAVQHDGPLSPLTIPPLSIPPHMRQPEPDNFPGSPTYRDPTLPQFRPNTIEQYNLIASNPPPPPMDWDQEVAKGRAHYDNLYNGGKAKTPIPRRPSSPKSDTQIPDKSRLYQLWKLDRAAKEAEERGGWARLNYLEFEALVKRFSKEGKANQMDYLGSWIEICIP